ncbi:chalcone isomerase family protein [Shewanella litorisediminis]|uniref:Chalcone isomerase family protein n=1 Tax=Shewanella litorisediminis TaxID=1173586 RepID=A0ABX7G5F4_9GAMM|nr:chalcone isomerase family protein [Shewanella litorisediminis]MCL2917435.1 chalcone isomerase family protein [Shewanella litorisediminis]QRH02567.1 chalcone isomerase family protein [Shewanella litorisediminis]
MAITSASKAFKRLSGALLLVALSSFSGASVSADNPLDGMSRVGKGKMTWLWLELYHASLYSVDGRYQAGRYPLALEIQYSREIEAKDLLEATGSEWQKQGMSEAQVKAFLAKLAPLWVDVRPGDTLLLVASDASHGEFFHNGQSLGSVNDNGLMQAFLGIWLRDDTSEPTLRAQLLGETSCDC